jgi:hypothetical protein
MRNVLIALWIMLLSSISSVAAQVSVGIGLPGVSIGINLPVYPELVPVPGYPVYYAPQVSSNYFFYDGMYWVYQRDTWYASSWYNGPWMLVAPEAVPLFVLRVPVHYYRRPPAYFRGWRSDAPPRWGEHWGHSWEQRRSGWDMWDRGAVPPPAPLPVYQRQYSGNRYPRVEQQQVLQSQNYRYQPQDAVVRQHYQTQPAQSASAPSPQVRQAVPQERSAPPQDQRVSRPPSSIPQVAPPPPHGQSPQTGGGDVQRPTAARVPPQPGGPTAQSQGQQTQQAAAQRQQQAPRTQVQDKPPQVNRPPQESRAPPHQTQQPQQAPVQHQQQAPTMQSQERTPQGKGPVQESKQVHAKGSDKGEQQGGEHNK